jgi:hypothetical protein
MLSNYISFKIFIVSFIIGLICVQLVDPETHKIYVYPSPDNYEKIQYRDKSQQCFQFKPIEIQCPINPFSIKTIPVQK